MASETNFSQWTKRTYHIAFSTFVHTSGSKGQSEAERNFLKIVAGVVSLIAVRGMRWKKARH